MSGSPLTLDQIRTWCAGGRVIVRGPLNTAYEISLDGRKVFVRHRIADDDEYGQTFAAERYLPEELTAGVRIPRLVQVLDDELGMPRYALFEFIEGVTPDWSKPEFLDGLTDVLLKTHRHLGSGFGSIGGDLKETGAGDFVRCLIDDELGRLPCETRLTRVLLEHRTTINRSAELFADEQPVLCHGDIHSGNFLADSDGQLWTLDWEAARFRVAAADFNQTQLGWLTCGQQSALLRIYSERSGRNLDVLRVQVRVLQLLWHIRTFNFYTLILGHDRDQHQAHLHAAVGIACNLESDEAT